MISKLLLLLCIDGATTYSAYRLKTVPHRYYLSSWKLYWADAKSYCRENYVDLATIDSPEDWIWLNKEVASKGLLAPAWVGLYTGWSWSYNDLKLRDMNYIHWAFDEPDNFGGVEKCGAMGLLGFWRDIDCSNLNPFVCFDDTRTGDNRFIEYPNPQLNWADALTFCRARNYDLAVLASAADNLVLDTFAFFHGVTWVGLFRDIWRWSDGTQTSTLPWLPTAPDNLNGHQNCGVFSGGKFDDANCNDLNYFFCHTSPLIPASLPSLFTISLLLRITFIL